MKKITALLLLVSISVANIATIFAADIEPTNIVNNTQNTGLVEGMPSHEDFLELNAEAGILYDSVTDRVIYNKNANKKMYPASTTKIMTALVFLDYFEPDEIIVAGYEVNEVPLDSSRAGNEVYEASTVENLVRGLLLPSGNDTAKIVSYNTALRHTGKEYLSFAEAENIFVSLMNEKAQELGATGTHFSNPDGYHADDHYTTAYDMALIAKEAMKNATIAQVAQEAEFNGASADLPPNDDYKIVQHNWINRNELIGNGANSYEYATGLKTGFTSLAGECLVATATQGEENLIVVLFNEPEGKRWEDAIKLFEYGFNNYDLVEIISNTTPLTEIETLNHDKNVDGIASIVGTENKTMYISDEERNNILYDIQFIPERVEQTEEGEVKLKAPISKGETLGTIAFTVGDDVVYTGSVASSNDIEKSTLFKDFEYYFNNIIDFVFSWKIIPTVGAIGLITIGVLKIKNKFRRRPSRYKMPSQNRRRRRRRR